MISPVTFVNEVRSELGKVVWPKTAEVVRSTIIVIAISVFIGVLIGGLDFVFVSITNIFVGGGRQ